MIKTPATWTCALQEFFFAEKGIDCEENQVKAHGSSQRDLSKFHGLLLSVRP